MTTASWRVAGYLAEAQEAIRAAVAALAEAERMSDDAADARAFRTLRAQADVLDRELGRLLGVGGR